MSNVTASPAAPAAGWPSVEILLLNWNGRKLLEMCLPPLVALDYPNFQVILIDNASTDDSVSFVKQQYPQVRIIVNEENLGYSRGMNVGLKQTQSDIVVLLNNDVVVRPDWLTALVLPFTEDKSIGIAGSKLLFPDGQTIQHAGARQEYPLAMSHHFYYGEIDLGQADTLCDVDYVTGAAMAMARQVLDDVGIFDEGFSPFYLEEVDLCARARNAGFRIVYVPASVAIHHESASIKQVDQLHHYTWLKNRLRFVLKHYSARQFLDDFLPAEIERLGGPSAARELRTTRQVYLETMLELPDILRQYEKGEWYRPVQAALVQLRETALAQRPSVDEPQRQSPLRAALAERQVIHEFEFSSGTPVIGPAVAALRRTWNDISTKWYVRAIIQQQMAFNALVARLLDEQDIQNQANGSEISMLANELNKLFRQFETVAAETSQELDELGSRMNQLEELLRRKLDRAPNTGKTAESRDSRGENL